MYENDDDFWDIEQILPPKSGVRFDDVDTESVEISFGEGTPSSSTPIPERHLRAKAIIETFEKKTSRLLFSYKPDIPLFEEVKIYAWPTKYPFYEKFVSDGEKYYRAACKECEYTPFFSYMPQYNQLNISQLRYYLKWRSGIRHGIFIKADFSYILLFIYELLNLENVSTPQKRLTALCAVWLAYRDIYPKLDRILSNWVCDFCLLHKLPAPKEKLGDIIYDIAPLSSLKEFYVSDFSSTAVDKYILSQSPYKYERSVYCQNPKNKALFNEHIIPAASYALSCADSAINIEKPHLTRISRDIYSGALCVSEVKCRIDIDYYSIDRDSKYKDQLGMLVKYCENGVRAHLGIKSRLSCTGLSDELKKYADEYFEKNLPPCKTQTEKRKEDEEKRYALYETDTSDFSTLDALKIEESSWEITKELVPDWEFEEEEETVIQTPSPDDTSPYSVFLSQLSPFLHSVLHCIFNNDKRSAEALCSEHGAFFEGTVDEINDIAASFTDDIIIEDGKIIDDYLDLLADAFNAEQ